MDNKELFFKLQESHFSLADVIFRFTSGADRTKAFSTRLKPLLDESYELTKSLTPAFYSNQDDESFIEIKKNINRLIQRINSTSENIKQNS